MLHNHNHSAGDRQQAFEQSKPLGEYLIEAGLLTEAQVYVALNDQQMTGMRFGDILATRGWVKEQTIEYLMEKIVVPDRQQQVQPPQPSSNPSTAVTTRVESDPQKPSTATQKRRAAPISKPLPSVNSVDNDVSWVG
jgi:hypothetical protein